MPDTNIPEGAVETMTQAVAASQEDPISGLDTTIKWQMVWLEAIALAWRDPEFKAELIKDPRKTLRAHFLFDLGPYVKLTVREATPPAGNNARGTRIEQVFNGWDPASDPLTSEMIMALPPAPAVEDQAVALSFYNASGRAYPFTCC
ncbi:MAG TPA: BMA_0021/BMA_0022 family TOMM bacteriocin [Kofleriaceae bacterium]|nr:BMA_0021/BMA_0022 family TOMM bacteriocin [Kofleriaceae bacterium]